MPDFHLWPWTIASETPDENIDWSLVMQATIKQAPVHVLRKLKRSDAIRLLEREDDFQLLSPESRETLLAIIEGRQARATTRDKSQPVKDHITDEMVLGVIVRGLEEAEANGDQAMVAKFAEMLAKHRALFDPGKQKGDVTIQVITGVPDGN